MKPSACCFLKVFFPFLSLRGKKGGRGDGVLGDALGSWSGFLVWFPCWERFTAKIQDTVSGMDERLDQSVDSHPQAARDVPLPPHPPPTPPKTLQGCEGTHSSPLQTITAVFTLSSPKCVVCTAAASDALERRGDNYRGRWPPGKLADTMKGKKGGN